MLLLLWVLACFSTVQAVHDDPKVVEAPVVAAAPALAVAPQVGDCSKAKNVCPSYAPAWGPTCPAGLRCVTFANASPTVIVALSYQIGCNGDGTAGAPQCNCTAGPTLAPGHSAAFAITDADYASCLPSWSPACLTAGLAVLANPGEESDTPTPNCATGTRIEFTAGNHGDPYGGFDSYNLDVEKDWYSVPVTMAPILACPGPGCPCASDNANHDCRPLVCDSATCPDAYATPTTGGCPDGRSPQAGCQDTFSSDQGYVVTYYPSPVPPSCQNATPCQGD